MRGAQGAARYREDTNQHHQGQYSKPFVPKNQINLSLRNIYKTNTNTLNTIEYYHILLNLNI